jgi:hypothetical protein
VLPLLLGVVCVVVVPLVILVLPQPVQVTHQPVDGLGAALRQTPRSTHLQEAAAAAAAAAEQACGPSSHLMTAGYV